MTANYTKLIPIPQLLTETLNLSYGSDMSYVERVKLRYNYIKSQLLINPDMEFWDYMETVAGTINVGQRDHIVHFKYIISSKGGVCSVIKDKGCYPIKVSPRPVYLKMSAVVGDKKLDVSIHRAIGCTMISSDKPHIDIRLNHLFTINHSDGVKTNNDFSNLEWATYQENVIHSRETGLHRSGAPSYSNQRLLGVYLLDDEYRGNTYRLSGTTEYSEITGKEPGGIRQSLRCKGNWYSLGFSWRTCGQAEYDKAENIPEFIRNKMRTDIRYLTPRYISYKITHIESGYTFCVIGKAEIESIGFSRTNTERVSQLPGTIYKGCAVEKITRKEVNLLPRGISDKMRKIIFGI